jgi:hypothetical protein
VEDWMKKPAARWPAETSEQPDVIATLWRQRAV